MRILQLVWSGRGYGGVESHVQALGCALRARGSSVFQRALYDLLPLAGFDAALGAALDQHAIDVVHAHNLHTARPPRVAERVAAVCASRDVPLVLTVHDLTDAYFASLPLVVETRHALRQARLVVTSEYNWRQALRFFGRRPDACIAPGIDFSRFSTTRSPEPATIAAPCRLIPGKGVIEALRGVGLYARHAGPQRLLLSDRGQESYGESDAFFAALRAEQERQPLVRCEHVGEPRVIPDIYARAQVVVAVPSLTEGFGLVALEALAAGRPVVARPTGGMTWVRRAPGVYVIDDPSPEAIDEALRVVLSRPDEWRQAALASAAMLKPSHDIALVADRYAALFANVIAADTRRLTVMRAR